MIIPVKNNLEKIELAKAYVALSNAHQLRMVEQMFDENANYHSSNVGDFSGRAAIREMMNGFFAQYPDVYWKTSDYCCDSNQNVLFHFEMTAIHTETGEKIFKKGTELIEFTANALISKLVVKAQ